MSSDASPNALETCDYCGLPLSAGWWIPSTNRAATLRPAYCCSGCRIAAAVTGSRGEEGQTRWMLARLGLAIFLSMNVVVFTMALWSGDIYGKSGDATGAGSPLAVLFRYLALVFSLPVLLLLGEPLVENAWQSLRRGQLSADVLIVVGVVAAYVYSAISTFRGEGHVYFEVGCVVLVVVSLGRWLEATGKLKTNEALDRLARLLPAEVRTVDGRMVPRESARLGDLLRVVPGERFAVDGQIVAGSCEVDEQIITGESCTVVKHMADEVFSGTLNIEGDILLRVTAAAGEETVSRMIEMVRRAREARGSYQRAADTVTAWFVPGVTLVALGTLFWHAASTSLESGLLAMLAVALIACPCALGLATPMAVWAAMGAAARRQVLFQQGEVIERLAAIRAVRLDKTGTLTTGDPAVDRFWNEPETTAEHALRRAAALTAGSAHVLAGAIQRFAASVSPSRECSQLRNLAGCGIEAIVDHESQPTCLGNLRWLSERGFKISVAMADEIAAAQRCGQSYSAIAWGGKVQAIFVFREMLRDHAVDALARLRCLGLDVAVLTGDHPRRAAVLAASLDVPFEGGLLPADKVAAIQRVRREIGPVAMVGDGINDAPALTTADVGVAMGCGADLSRNTAGVCLLGSDLLRLPDAIEFARLTRRVIRQNLFWAFSYNTIGIAMASVGWLNPVWAAIAMAASSLLVVSNSLRLVAWDPPPQPAQAGTEFESSTETEVGSTRTMVAQA